MLPAADLADRLRLDAEEERELRAPLIEQRPAVHEDERAAVRVAAMRLRRRPSCRRPAGRRRRRCRARGERERPEPGRRVSSPWKETWIGSPASRLSSRSSVTPCSRSNASRSGRHPRGRATCCRQVLGARDDPRRQRRRQPHALLLVELRVLEGGKPLDLVQERRGQAGLLDEEPLREDRPNPRRERPRDPNRPLARRQARPRATSPRSAGFARPNADHRTLLHRLADETLDSRGGRSWASTAR